jgi:small subunit ribosomal protein S11
MEQGMQRANVMIKGAGVGGDAALRAILRSGIVLGFIREVTHMPHNGCSPGPALRFGLPKPSQF